ncbi:MAG TPA: hypothetical protein VFQ89_12290 [Candidatus Binatia bacterium]|nr:hypothetical protein [Candidatus Binatia bacterium]
MKPILSAIALLALGVILVAEAGAGPRRGIVTPRAGSGVRSFSGGVPGRAVVQRQFYSGYPYYYQQYYQPYYPPVLVISPYAQAYILPPTVVANEPYFCVLHNEGFVSRIGLVDHLAGTHKIPLEAATSLCPHGGGSCIFPSH